ncbi:annexin D4-like [Cucurbita maxima]|uniref:Annexin D4-like n=1 Tax=Cucurbita maxima TaxID=3661 RepID=A0A6J1HQX4_CUCMA|nr:annexin D4-like [Cucurbita maxima]
MADSAIEVLTRALSGHGINEKAMIDTLGNWDHEHKKLFRIKSSHIFSEDERSFERWQEHAMRLLKHEFMRFKNAVVLWTTHPWERDARLVREALSKGNHGQNINILIEVACTRTSDELLGARKAYHSLFDHSIEEDVASHINAPERKLLVALMSAYRYEGPKYKEEIAKSEAEKLARAIKEAGSKRSSLIEDDEVVRILSTRSKHFLHVLYNHYKKISAGRSIDEDLDWDLKLQDAVLCLANPVKYFTHILEVSLKVDADKKVKKVLTRIIVTRADKDMKEIKIEFKNKFGVSLEEKIESVCNGSYKDFLLTLLARSD